MIVVTGATGNVGRTLRAGCSPRRASRSPPWPATSAQPTSRRRARRRRRPGRRRQPAPRTGQARTRCSSWSPGRTRTGCWGGQGRGRREDRAAVHAGCRDPARRPTGTPARFEQAVRESGLDFTILRSGGMASNAYAWAEPVRLHRTAAAPFGDVGPAVRRPRRRGRRGAPPSCARAGTTAPPMY